MKQAERATGQLVGPKPLNCERVSRNESEPASENLETRKDESAQDHRRERKPAPGRGKMTEPRLGLSGVKSGGALRKNKQELGRPALAMGKAAKSGVEGNNTSDC